MKSLENNENCKKEDIFENDNYLTIESYFYPMGVFSSKKKIAILYLSLFYLMLLGA